MALTVGIRLAIQRTHWYVRTWTDVMISSPAAQAAKPVARTLPLGRAGHGATRPSITKSKGKEDSFQTK